MSITQSERRAAELAVQREARLQQMSTTQHERRTAESSQLTLLAEKSHYKIIFLRLCSSLGSLRVTARSGSPQIMPCMSLVMLLPLY